MIITVCGYQVWFSFWASWASVYLWSCLETGMVWEEIVIFKHPQQKRVSIFISRHCHKSPAQKLRLTPNIFKDNDITEIFCGGRLEFKITCVWCQSKLLFDWITVSFQEILLSQMWCISVLCLPYYSFPGCLYSILMGGLERISGCCNTVVGF